MKHVIGNFIVLSKKFGGDIQTFVIDATTIKTVEDTSNPPHKSSLITYVLGNEPVTVEVINTCEYIFDLISVALKNE